MKKIYLITRQNNFFFNSHLNIFKKLNISYTGVIVDKKKYTKDQKKNILSRINIKLFDISPLRDKKIYYINHNSKEFISFLKNNNAELLINLGTPRIFNKLQIKNLPPILNCHPGILPYYKGCSTPEWAFLNKDNVGGTVHLMNEKIDDGKILFTKIFKKKKFKNYKEFRTYVHLSCIKFYCRVIKIIISTPRIDRIIHKKVAINSENGKYWKPMNKLNFEKLIKFIEKSYQ